MTIPHPRNPISKDKFSRKRTPSMRLIFYLGKGGTGKTTVAAATALRCAHLGYRTLVVSTDMAHSLADALDQPLNSKPVAVTKRLWGQEINTIDEVRSHWKELQDYADAILRRRGMTQVIAEELAIVPGMEEIACLLHIHRYSRDKNFDVIVVDAAPTGETIRLLAIPETFKWYVSRFDQKGDQMWKLAQLFGLMSSHEMFNLLSKIDIDVSELRQILTDPEISSYRVVLNPEKMVVKESQRAITYLNLFGYPVDAGIINRVLPADPSPDPYLRHIQEIQKHYLRIIQDSFAPFPMFEVPWYNKEVVGLQAMDRMAEFLWSDSDPAQIFWHGPTQEIEERGEEFVLRMPLPHIELEKVTMTKRGDELFVTIGNFKRELILPSVLAIREATTAKLTSDGILEIHFSQHV